MIDLYAPIQAGRVTGADGNSYGIQNGKVRVPRVCVDALILAGYKLVPPTEVSAAGLSAGDIVASQVIVGTAAPSNADGRPDGTIYIQSPGGLSVKAAGAYVASGGSSSVSALAASPRLMHLVGDSLTGFAETTVGSSTDYDARSAHAHAMAVSGGALQIGNVLGMSGSGTVAINAALPAFLTGLPAGSLVNYWCGANDSASTAAATLAALTAGIALIENAGLTPIVCTILPNAPWLTSAALDLKRIQVNNGLRRLCDTRRSAGKPFIFVDWDHLPFTTQTNDTLTIRTGYFADGTHPGTMGAEDLGIFWWNAVKAFVPAPTASAPFADATTNRFANPFNEPTAAGGGNVTGITVNAISAGTGAATSNRRVRGTAGDGVEWLEVTWKAPDAAGGYASIQTAALPGGAGTFSMAMQVEVDVPDASSLIECKMRIQNFTNNKIRRHLMQPVSSFGAATAADYYSAGTKKWFLRTPPVTLDASEGAGSTVAYVDLMIAAGKTVTLRARRLAEVPKPTL